MEQSEQPNLHLLHDWLRSEANNKNILIPTSVGGKRPTRRYKDDVWTWEEYDKMVELEKKQQYQSKSDWGIILKDICVIDVDSPAVAASLEARFPELLLTPCAETKHGFHYYFRRSKLADDAKYYDGAGQRLNKVDFKSITRTGTGGFIVVPPSADKKWILNRAPWETDMTSIPDVLLSTVARPYGNSDKEISTDHNMVTMDKSTSDLDNDAPKPKLKLKERSNAPLSKAPLSEKTVELIFENDDQGNMIVSGFEFQLLAESDYFGALLSGRWSVRVPGNTNDDDSTNSSSVRTLTMPCDRNVCEEIFSLLQTEMMTHSSEPTIKLLAKIDSTMDMLGIFYSKNPLLFRSAFFADLYDINRDMWHVHCQEIELMLGTSATASDLSLVCIDDDLAQCTGYTPMKKDARWMFEELPCMLPAARFENVKVFVDQPEDTLMSQMPLAVLAILRRHPTNIVVAGGAVLGGISNFVDHGSDVDLFVHGLDQEQSSALLVDIEEFIQKGYKYTITKSLAAVTFTNNEDHSKDKYGNINEKNLLDRPFQIVLGLHRARSQVIEHFDLTPCKCLARIDENSEFIVEALPSFVLALTHMSFFVDIMYWTPFSVTRITKYIAKGFECFVPGLKRSALKVSTHNKWGWGCSYYDRTKGLSLLFVAESEVINSRNFSSEEEFTFVEPITGRLRPIEASVIASKVAQKLGSGVSSKPSDMYGHMCTGTYGFIAESFRRDVAVRLGDHRNGIPIGTVFFAFTEAGRFNPSDACLEDMYDQELLAAVATEEMAARALKMSTMPICSSCGSDQDSIDQKFKICPCGDVRYCDTTCQRIHWKQSHKVICQSRKNKKNTKNANTKKGKKKN